MQRKNNEDCVVPASVVDSGSLESQKQKKFLVNFGYGIKVKGRQKEKPTEEKNLFSED